ncbi:uncharacterized protein TNCV_2857271 [Trichonephila clavipes]|nr:uncharacterized protein TNCV_2857271 [Trichonephila clavipes]
MLQPHVLPLMHRLPGAIFEQDNARPHMTRVSQDRLRTVTTIPGLAAPQICLKSSICSIIWDGELDIPKFERTRGKVTANMERNVLRHYTELICLNARSYRIVHSR